MKLGGKPGESLKVAIRVDASALIGTGHVMRCLTLGYELRRRCNDVYFICRKHPGHLCQLIKNKRFQCIDLPVAGGGDENKKRTDDFDDVSKKTKHADWLGVHWITDAEQTLEEISVPGSWDWFVVDHYGLDARWESRIRTLCRHFMVIDDLADRTHNCDLLLDQNLYDNETLRYQELVPPHCVLLLGPGFALLRPEFLLMRQNLRRRYDIIKRILIFFGGVDATNETMKAITALDQLDMPSLYIDVVIGNTNPHRKQLSSYCAGRSNIQLHRQVNYIAELMMKSDLAIGGAGVATWERCSVGLPTIVTAIADNQLAIAEAVAATGAIRYLGFAKDVSEAQITDVVRELNVKPDEVAQMSQSGLSLVDAEGAVRVVDAMENTV